MKSFLPEYSVRVAPAWYVNIYRVFTAISKEKRQRSTCRTRELSKTMWCKSCVFRRPINSCIFRQKETTYVTTVVESSSSCVTTKRTHKSREFFFRFYDFTSQKSIVDITNSPDENVPWTLSLQNGGVGLSRRRDSMKSKLDMLGVRINRTEVKKLDLLHPDSKVCLDNLLDLDWIFFYDTTSVNFSQN